MQQEGENSIFEKYYETDYGYMLLGESEKILSSILCPSDISQVNLIFTSPPFPLNRAKKYGNTTGKDYLKWVCELGPVFKGLLAQDGSLVIELGNAWEQGLPIQSTLPIETLLALKQSGEFNLCQEFIYYNPAKLPSPVEWVNKRRIRVKDSFTRFWWLSNTPYPKANNLKIIEEYSMQMKKLLKSGKYNSGLRPSEYSIGTSSFAKDNGGAIPSNVLIVSNTVSNDEYIRYCKKNGLSIHPARMPREIVEFFVKFLTDEGDLVFDPFAGSNTTGFVAEILSRKWVAIEASEEYIKGSMGRFEKILYAVKGE
jgi:site-specific DNA-methyltransferase (cytosine-N4-specific)